MSNQALITKLIEIKKLADEAIGSLSNAHTHHQQKNEKDIGPKQADSGNLILSIINKVNDCDESEMIQTEILDLKSMEAKILLCFFISHKYFNNAWLTTGDIEKITSGLGAKIAVGNVSNKIKSGLRQYLESGAVRKKGQPTPYRLNRKGVKHFESLLNKNEKNNESIESFVHSMSNRIIKMSDRAIALLYFCAVKKDAGITLKEISENFDKAGLGKPNITKLRKALVKDKRTKKISDDAWRLKSDKIAEVENQYHLSNYLQGEPLKLIAVNGNFVDKKRFQELKKKRAKFDFSRFCQMLLELDRAFSMESYISVIFLVRAILDHVPPIFNLNSFTEVANNYGTKSFKDSMSHLENSSRKIADSYLHTRIRNKESLPNKTQVNFSNDLDVLLAEIIRIS